jgi:hypothetical protein
MEEKGNKQSQKNHENLPEIWHDEKTAQLRTVFFYFACCMSNRIACRNNSVVPSLLLLSSMN